MKKDRKFVDEVLMKVVSNCITSGDYDVSECAGKLEEYIETQRYEAIGWMTAEAVYMVNEGIDIREVELDDIVAGAKQDLDTGD